MVGVMNFKLVFWLGALGIWIVPVGNISVSEGISIVGIFNIGIGLHMIAQLRVWQDNTFTLMVVVAVVMMMVVVVVVAVIVLIW